MDVPTVTTEEALERAVLDDPGSDTPRLAYADRLSETAGDVVCPDCKGEGKTSHRSADASWIPSFAYKMECSRCYGRGRVPDGRAARAEFIRVQCEIAKLGSACERSRDGGTAYMCVGFDEGRHEPTCPRRRERELWDAGVWRAFLLPWPAGAERGRPFLSDMRRGFVSQVVVSADSLDALPPVLARHPVETVRVGEARVEIRKVTGGWVAFLQHGPTNPDKIAYAWSTRAALVAGLVPWLRERLTHD